MIDSKEIVSFAKDLYARYSGDDALNLGASLAYYTVFSIAPIVIIIIAVAGFFLGPEAVEGKVFGQLEGFLGADGAKQVQEIVANSYRSKSGIVATAISVGTLVFGATGVVYQLKSSLNKVWEVKAQPKNNLVRVALDRLLSLGLILSIGAVILIIQVVNALVAGFSDYLSQHLPDVTRLLLYAVNWLINLGAMAVFFALIFKFLPDARIRWRDTWAGALFAALLFALGRIAINYYIGFSNFGDTFGAAGAIVVLLVWVYYNSQVLFLGAEFAAVYAERRGARIEPASYAVRYRRQVTIEEMEGRTTDQA